MRIVDIRDIVAPISSAIANAYIDFSTMTTSVVAIVTDRMVDGEPVVGFGFNSNGRYAPQGLLRERFIPRLRDAKPDELLDDRYNGGVADETAWVYAAGGYYYPGKGLDALQDEMRSYLERGYDTVKMKIGGVPLDEDLRRIDAVLEIVGEGKRLAVDVNGRFDLDTGLAYGRAMTDYGLRWYEEPFDPLDYLPHAALAADYAGPLATGENLFSMQDARNLIRYGGLRADR